MQATLSNMVFVFQRVSVLLALYDQVCVVMYHCAIEFCVFMHNTINTTRAHMRILSFN